MRRKKLNLSATSDWIHTENVGKMRFGKRAIGEFGEDENEPLGERKFYIFYLAVFLICLLFLARLFMLTIVDGEKNRALAEGNRIRLVKYEAPRGKIFDRNGQILADSRQIYTLEKNGKDQTITQIQAKE